MGPSEYNLGFRKEKHVKIFTGKSDKRDDLEKEINEWLSYSHVKDETYQIVSNGENVSVLIAYERVSIIEPPNKREDENP